MNSPHQCSALPYGPGVDDSVKSRLLMVSADEQCAASAALIEVQVGANESDDSRVDPLVRVVKLSRRDVLLEVSDL